MTALKTKFRAVPDHLKMLLPALLAAFFLTHNPWFLFSFVNGRSMMPDFPPHSLMLAVKGRSAKDSIKNGDVIIFRHKGIRGRIVKRVSGIAGDTVENCPNGRACHALRVPDGAFFVTGDNSAESIDSRIWEEPFVSEDEVEAVVKLLIRPSLSLSIF